jgi:hypothetical protein
MCVIENPSQVYNENLENSSLLIRRLKRRAGYHLHETLPNQKDQNQIKDMGPHQNIAAANRAEETKAQGFTRKSTE